MGTNNVAKILKKRDSEGNIELDSFDKLKENSFVYGSNAKCWFKFDDNRILFKEYENDLEAFGEVLYSKVAKRHGINCADYDFAIYKGEKGTISYDVSYENDLVVIDGVTLFARYNPDNLPDIIRKNTTNLDVLRMFNKKYNNYQQLSKLFEKRYPESLNELQQEMIKMFILDVLFDHVDKNLWNVMIVTDKYGNEAHMVSIDSSHVACLYRGKEYIKEAIDTLLVSDGSITIEDYLSGGIYGYDVDVKDRDYNPAKDLIEFYYNCDETQRDEIMEFVKNFDIEEDLKELVKLKKLDTIILTWVNAVISSRKSFLLRKFYHINDNFIEEHSSKNFHLRKGKNRLIY